jgi:hypothetical protein
MVGSFACHVWSIITAEASCLRTEPVECTTIEILCRDHDLDAVSGVELLHQYRHVMLDRSVMPKSDQISRLVLPPSKR